MLILERHASDRSYGNHVIALFGVGTVGGAVTNSLISSGWRVAEDIAISWENESGRRKSLVDCGSALVSLRRMHGDGICSFVWSAGRAGFSSGMDQVEQELDAFRDVLNLFCDVIPKLYSRSQWHHVSSAGGLFEGQRLVVASSRPNPQRPYGELKLRQEEALQVLSEAERVVYRLSSIFGSVRRGQRCGLIPTMAKNGVLGRLTRIVGRPGTLRDFAWTEDVANFIARAITQVRCGQTNIFLMASGRPVSISEVQRQVEKSLRRRLYVNYSEQQNGSDITFSERAIPEDFRRTNLDDCIHRVCRECLADVALIA
ncbi:MAG: NAD-dependent epimerase/dehydratase family protein [Planctomycetaceae bacterium]|nr:NAD-dependent epimerase/dehydratase family protein [Planctomycetaceae bacterium]